MQEKSVIYFNISLLSDDHLEGRNMHESRNSFSKTACSEVGHKVGHTGCIQTSAHPKKLPGWWNTASMPDHLSLQHLPRTILSHISIVEYLLSDILTKWNKVHEQWGYPKGISAIKPEKVCSIGSWLMTYQQPLRLVHPSLISQVLCLVYSNFTNLQHTWNEVTNPLLKWGKWKGHHRSLVFNPC